jgi:putative Mg2+ transporter-C (MgtC) family protein
MPIALVWPEIALRLGLSILAGTLMGLDRGEHGRPAGLRTTLLVCLAATVVMLQVNLLLATTGKPSDSFITLDLMRLPLGILTGMGFIGGGVILRRDGLVIGVTTAATLWFVTVIGLCFGSGQIGLGAAALVLGVTVLSGLRWFESTMKQDHYAKLIVTTDGDELAQKQICDLAVNEGYRIQVLSLAYSEAAKHRTLEFQLKWRAPAQTKEVPAFMSELSQDLHISSIRWENGPKAH